MLTKYKYVKNPFKNVFMSAVYSKSFSRRGHHFDILSSVFFSDRIILKHIENEKGSRGHTPLENLHTAVVILVLFEEFSGKFCLLYSASA